MDPGPGSGGGPLFVGSDAAAATSVSLDQETAWKLFSKGLTTEEARSRIGIDGDTRLGQRALSALAVMA